MKFKPLSVLLAASLLLTGVGVTGTTNNLIKNDSMKEVSLRGEAIREDDIPVIFKTKNLALRGEAIREDDIPVIFNTKNLALRGEAIREDDIPVIFDIVIES